jgi:7-keto-8-aminopelargonate synthetase-like enzyme
LGNEFSKSNFDTKTQKACDSMSWTDDIHEELHELDAQGLRRRLRTVDLLGGMRASVENKDCVLFCTNNYLGLADHPHVLERSSKTILH